ncbi:RagB/SusD family nutrient uptake outer membrane protein [Flammeovirga pectinis]|uniref:RagB/SusD family nutrient uptake outer membrane protein n=1 Tax=Flammeovirga pectinis TaxID=2494373 RepID=A0A3Q9FLK1_9BACT|nr:RagB/SusD family nutrient uptake outer membrane protein [Flammeovirga pectinis]AZQ61381.1 RagB/SusD family nutrient uptake outer membrane protein [Flammeovirga pectinis]
MKIKHILIAGGLALGSLSMTSCADYLELQPTNAQTSDTFFRSSTEARQALVGIYEKLRSDYNGAPNSTPMFDMAMGDDAYVGGDPSGTDMIYYQQMSKFQAQTNNEAGQAAWNKCFGGIQRANTLLANYDKIEFTTAETEIQSQYKGEATFLRAHYYFELARLFENIPVFTVPLSGDEWKAVEQSTVDNTYATIAKDIMDAIPLMATAIPEGEEGRLNQFAAKAELVKIFMFYTGVYGKSELPVLDGTAISKADIITIADDVITNSGATLATNYEDLFNQSGNYNKEVLFEIPFANTGSGDWGDWSYGSIFCQMSGPRGYNTDLLAQGWGFTSPSRELEAAYEANDSRKAATLVYAKDLIDLSGSVYQAQYNFTSMHSNKYTTHGWNKATVNVELNWAQNYHYIRLADILLLAAELNVTTDAGKALGYFNQVRTRAGLAPKGAITIVDIQNERRTELALEGHRYFDVLRRGLTAAAAELNVTGYTLTPPTDTDPSYVDDNGNNLTGDVGKADSYNVSFDAAKRGFLPIPQVEVDLHSMLKQNAGY